VSPRALHRAARVGDGPRGRSLIGTPAAGEAQIGMIRSWLAVLLLVPACSSCRATTGAPPSTVSPSVAIFEGMCDASGAIPLSATSFAVADDEDNVLRTYDAARAGPPLSSVDISAGAGVFAKANARTNKPPPEIDIEAATLLGDLAFWIGSHGRSSSGKLKHERLRLFATTLPRGQTPLEVIGASYDGLLAALTGDARYAAFDLESAAARAPKEPGGLNIEGMAARREGGLWIGFRSPTPGGRALLAALENPQQVVHGAPARLGPPTLLDLGGLGIRDLSWWRGAYWIIAGDTGDRVPSRLYRWDGRGAPRPLDALDLTQLNPEALFAPPQGERLMILSDDGTRELDGVECKELEDPSRKRFRAVWLTPRL
jgi:hypothetical protein